MLHAAFQKCTRLAGAYYFSIHSTYKCPEWYARELHPNKTHLMQLNATACLQVGPAWNPPCAPQQMQQLVPSVFQGKV